MLVCLALLTSGCWFNQGDGHRAPGVARSATNGQSTAVRGKGKVTVGRTTLTALGVSDKLLVLSPAGLKPTQKQQLASLLQLGVIAGVPFYAESSTPGSGRYTLTRTYRAPLPEGATATWSCYKPALGTWVPVPSVVSPDRRSVTATVTHLSLWDDVVSGTAAATASFSHAVTTAGGQVEQAAGGVAATAAQLSGWAETEFTKGAEGLFYGVGALFDTRVVAPTCVGQPPAWASRTTFISADRNNPILWCVGHDVNAGGE